MGALIIRIEILPKGSVYKGVCKDYYKGYYGGFV